MIQRSREIIDDDGAIPLTEAGQYQTSVTPNVFFISGLAFIGGAETKKLELPRGMEVHQAPPHEPEAICIQHLKENLAVIVWHGCEKMKCSGAISM